MIKIIEDKEERKIWDFIYKKYKFNPSTKLDVIPFVFDVRVKCYKLNILNDTYAFKLHLMYNYLKKNFKTNLFEDCFIEISNSKFKKPRRLYE